MTSMRKRWASLAAATGFLVALLPLGSWYVRRMGDGSDEPLGLMALAIAMVMLWSCRNSQRATAADRWTALALFGLYGVTVWLGFPPLGRALPALGAVVLWTGAWRLPGVSILLGLSLPVMASMQFYLGYPMRVLTAGISSATLNLLSLPVHRVGTQLMFDGATLGVDAPCSGIRMLWMSCLFAAVAIGLFRLGWRAAAGLLSTAVLVALLANSLRATVLFFPESGMIHLPSWGHEGTGLLLHVLGMLVLLGMARRLQLPRPSCS